MIKELFSLLIIVLLTANPGLSQAFIRTSELFSKRTDQGDGTGNLNIIQDKAIDTLVDRHILANGKLRTVEGSHGIEGYRIQIYYSNIRNAREEAARAMADFISGFPDIKSYFEYREPGYFMVRAGNYRTKTEVYKDLMAIRKKFPNAYWVPAVIEYPGLIKRK